MRLVILMRHADAVAPAAGQHDFDRELTDAGRQQAMAQGQWLAGRELPIARVLCSPAVRTRQTAEAAGLPVTHPVKGIYEATVGELVRVLESHADAEIVVLLGHNPGLQGLAGYLTGRPLQMKPGTVVGILLPAGQSTPQPGSGQVRLFRHPDGAEPSAH